MNRLNLAPGQRRDLQCQLAQASDVRVYRRTLGVLEVDRGRPMADVADALGVTHVRITPSFPPEATNGSRGAAATAVSQPRCALRATCSWREAACHRWTATSPPAPARVNPSGANTSPFSACFRIGSPQARPVSGFQKRSVESRDADARVRPRAPPARLSI
jgi:hypothetical protein